MLPIIFIIDVEINNVNLLSHRNSKTLKRFHVTQNIVKNRALYTDKFNSHEASETN